MMLIQMGTAPGVLSTNAPDNCFPLNKTLEVDKTSRVSAGQLALDGEFYERAL